MTQSTLYGVFMLRHGTWQLRETYNCKATAEQDVKYVGEVLGLPSKLMIRDLDSPATHTAYALAGGYVEKSNTNGVHLTMPDRLFDLSIPE